MPAHAMPSGIVRTMSSHSPRLVAAVVASGLLFAACGSGGGEQAGDAVSAPAADELPEPAPGPVPELAVTTQSSLGSSLPEVAVRRLNGEGGWVQFKNELPSELPLLVWFWAPY